MFTLAVECLPGAEPLVGAAVADDIAFVASSAAGRGELLREFLDLVFGIPSVTPIIDPSHYSTPLIFAIDSSCIHAIELSNSCYVL